MGRRAAGRDRLSLVGDALAAPGSPPVRATGIALSLVKPPPLVFENRQGEPITTKTGMAVAMVGVVLADAISRPAPAAAAENKPLHHPHQDSDRPKMSIDFLEKSKRLSTDNGIIAMRKEA